ncbi:MAG: hypothetical protein E6789_00740 [Clostridium baratii]|nr:hypothetical protein [Clostridium baratii]
MSLKIKGFKNLNKKLTELAEAPDNVKEQVTKQCADIALAQMKQDAPKDEGEGASALRITEHRSGEGYSFYDIGIDSSNWEQTKGLYFNHFGFSHWKGKAFINPHQGWFDHSAKKSIKKAKTLIEGAVYSELRKAGL